MSKEESSGEVSDGEESDVERLEGLERLERLERLWLVVPVGVAAWVRGLVALGTIGHQQTHENVILFESHERAENFVPAASKHAAPQALQMGGKKSRGALAEVENFCSRAPPGRARLR